MLPTAAMPGRIRLQKWQTLVSVMILICANKITSSSSTCCSDEPTPLANCSIASKSQGNILCHMTSFMSDGMSCAHDRWENDQNLMPNTVNNFNFHLYKTKCAHTLIDEDTLGESEPCQVSCEDRSGKFYTGINVTFKLPSFTASKLEGIEISLFGLSGHHAGYQWCTLFDYRKGSINFDTADQHTVYFDRYIGLIPGNKYNIKVRTLPTARQGDRNLVRREFGVPVESSCPMNEDESDCYCETENGKFSNGWQPSILWDEDPPAFTINFTLFLDLGEVMEYSQYISNYIISVQETDVTSDYYEEKTIENQPESDYYRRRPVAHVTFHCVKPATYKITITAEGCLQCPDYNKIYIVTAEKPVIRHCPSNQTYYEEAGTEGAVAANWSNPDVMGSLVDVCLPVPKEWQSHQPGDLFPVGTSTLVVYEFWWFESAVARCTFNVDIVGVEKPAIHNCPDNITIILMHEESEVEVYWLEPSANGSRNQSHWPGDQFHVNSVTKIVYEFWQHEGIAKAVCTFYVDVQEGATLPIAPIIGGCMLGIGLILVTVGCIFQKKYPIRCNACSFIFKWIERLKGHNKKEEPGGKQLDLVDPRGEGIQMEALTWACSVTTGSSLHLSTCALTQSAEKVQMWINKENMENLCLNQSSTPCSGPRKTLDSSLNGIESRPLYRSCTGHNLSDDRMEGDDLAVHLPLMDEQSRHPSASNSLSAI